MQQLVPPVSTCGFIANKTNFGDHCKVDATLRTDFGNLATERDCAEAGCHPIISRRTKSGALSG
jgi:hypothetical protein